MIDSVSESAGGAAGFETDPAPQTAGHSMAAKVDRLPPHSPEAEQGVLGCVLLSPNDCMGECIEKFKSRRGGLLRPAPPDDFRDAGRRCTTAREAIDIITLQQRLKDKQLLEQVGGIAYLSAPAGHGAVGGQPELLPGHRPGEVPAAENDPHLHGRRGPGLRLRGRGGRAAGRGGAGHPAHQRIAGAEPAPARSRTWSTKAIKTIEDFHQRQGMLTGVGTGLHRPGQDDQRPARRRNDRDRRAAFAWARPRWR